MWPTDAARCPINYAVLDSDWEGEFCRVLDHHPRVLAWVKNQGLGLEVPCQDGGTARVYVPDFVVRLDVGVAEPVNLVLEVKGFRGGAAPVKASTWRRCGCRASTTSAAGGAGRSKEFREVFLIEGEFEALVASLCKTKVEA